MPATINKKAEPANAVLYLRTGSADQEDIRRGLQTQQRLCEEYARQLGLRITDIYCDAGVSGLSERRPALGRLLRALSFGRIDYVIAADRARLARSHTLEQSLEERITRDGVGLVTGEQLHAADHQPGES
jgi:DNA invertase Pin-like site-specific DNA recombinase